MIDRHLLEHEPASLGALKFIRLRCRLRAFDSIAFNSFPDSIMSRMLKAFTHLPDCRGRYQNGPCSLPHCPYGEMFSHQSNDRLPADFRHHPPPAVAIDLNLLPNATLIHGEPFDLGLMIAGRAIDRLAHLLQAVALVGAQGLVLLR